MNGTQFERAVSNFKNNIYGIAFHYFRNPQDAEDIVQEVFLKLYRETKEFESEEHLRNWLIRVTINQCKKISVSSWFTKHTSLPEYAAGIWPDPQEEKMGNEESDLFLNVMALPKKYRIAVHLYYYEDYSTKEIAELLRVKEATVRTRLARARKMLKDTLSEVWKDE